MKPLKLLLLSVLLICLQTRAQNWLWGRQGTTRSNLNGVGADGKGNTFLTGSFLDSITFSGTHLTSINTDIYLVKYDSLGNLLWARQSTGGPTNIESNAATADAAGNIYITGYFVQPVTFGANSLSNSHVGGYNAFLIKYDASGNVVWAWQSGGSAVGSAFGCSISIDPSGNVFVSGGFKDTVNFGTFTLVSKTTYNGDAFVLKFNTSGNVLWAKQSSAAIHSTARGSSIATDAGGNAFITGWFTDTVTFGTSKLINISHTGDAFLAKYDYNGNLLWVDQSVSKPSGGWANTNSVTTDLNGNAYITGGFQDTISFGTNILISHQYIPEMVLAKYTPSGGLVWAKQSQGGPTLGSCQGNSIMCDIHNSLFFFGQLSGAVNHQVIFDMDTLTINGKNGSGAVLKLDTSARILCSSIITASGTSRLVCDPSGNYIYLGGYISDSITFGKDWLNSFSSTEPPFLARWHTCGKITGTNELSSNSNIITLYPDPNNGVFIVSYLSELVSASHQTIEIYNMLGEKMYSTRINNVKTSIDLGNNCSGIYLYKVLAETGNVISEGKFIMQKGN